MFIDRILNYFLKLSENLKFLIKTACDFLLFSPFLSFPSFLFILHFAKQAETKYRKKKKKEREKSYLSAYKIIRKILHLKIILHKEDFSQKKKKKSMKTVRFLCIG